MIARTQRGDRMKITKRVLIALTVLALAGCASVQDLRDEPASNIFHSIKPPQAVAECIRDAWQSQEIGIRAVGAALQSTGGEYTISSPTDNNPYELAVVTPASGGSLVALHPGPSSWRKGKRVDALKPCL